MISRGTAVAASLGAMLLVLAACSSSPGTKSGDQNAGSPSPTSSATLVQAANKEGTVNVYWGLPADAQAPHIAAFNKVYRISGSTLFG